MRSRSSSGRGEASAVQDDQGYTVIIRYRQPRYSGLLKWWYVALVAAGLLSPDDALVRYSPVQHAHR